jgi:hypothetical protein
MPFNYIPKTEKQLKANYNRRVKQGLNGFLNFQDFCNWYLSQDLICHYCGLSEIESQKISTLGLLRSNRFPQNGVISRGKSRGVWLEVDRFTPEGLYSRENCVICCYFCNNDKSDVFNGREYLIFFQNRVEFLRNLITD